MTENARTTRKLCVLVADDDRARADDLAMIVRSSGHEAWVVHDGEAALRLAADRWPDIGVLGLGSAGYEVARRLRQLPSTRSALLLALTGYGQAQDRRRAEEAGFDRHFAKPADPTALLAAVDEWVHGLGRDLPAAAPPFVNAS